jgi:hypothetical protein
MEWGDYWRKVCAPKLKRRKGELGRGLPEHEIAAYVEAKTGKRSERGLVSLWLLGKREPYISQFFALCEKLEMDPFEILSQERPSRVGAITHRDVAMSVKPYKLKKLHGRG